MEANHPIFDHFATTLHLPATWRHHPGAAKTYSLAANSLNLLLLSAA
jgi:hypothetical protein